MNKPSHICMFTDKCPIYQGTEKMNDSPLFVIKNVFCHRGSKGWKNCERHAEFQEKSEQ